MRAPLMLFLLATVPLAACARAAGDATRFAERDSAGVRIATTSGPGWPADRPGWRVVAEPTLAIGTLEGDLEFQLDNVQGLTRMSDGRIAVAVGATQELRFFGPDGSFQGRAGRQGGGPGEFEGLGGLWRLTGDTLATWDYQLRRVSRFGSHGGFIASVPIEPTSEAPHPQLLGIFGDGSALVRSGSVVDFQVQPGTRLDSTRLLRYTPGGELAQDYGVFPSHDGVVVQTTDAEGRAQSVTAFRLPFGRQVSFVAADDLLWVAPADKWELHGYDRSGGLVRIIRREAELVPLQRAEIDSFVQAELARARIEYPNFVSTMRQVYDAAVYPTLKAPYGRLVMGGDGSFWLDLNAGNAQPAWAVFTPQGRYLGDVTMPGGFNLHEAGPDYLLGTWQDDVGVTYIHLHQLER